MEIPVGWTESSSTIGATTDSAPFDSDFNAIGMFQQSIP